jgi:hypothetical protein
MHCAAEGGGTAAWKRQVQYAGQASTRFSGQSKKMKLKGGAAAASDALVQGAVSVPSVCRKGERCGTFGMPSNPPL